MRVGFDEVGRGSLAGPVVVGLVSSPETWPLKIYPKSTESEQAYLDHKSPILRTVNDSKKLIKKTRAAISEYIVSSGLEYCVLQGSASTIDRFGIGKILSHLLAIGLEIMAHKVKTNEPIKVYIDGRIKLIKLDPLLVEVLLEENGLSTTIDHNILVRQMQTDLLSGFEKFVLIREDKADSTYLTVALASNIAKEWRDDKMVGLSKEYPHYGWDTNVGYGTKQHRDAIVKHPINPYLRTTWLKNILV